MSPALDPGLEVRRRALRLANSKLGEDGFLADKVTAAAQGLSPADGGLLRLLALGVVRHRVTLDAVLTAVSGRLRAKQDPWVWGAARLGAFQMLLCDAIPDHAAVDSAVALAREKTVKAGGFVNAVLRNVQRARETRIPAGEPPGDAMRAIPLPAGGHVRLRLPVLPDPAVKPDAWLADAFSLPIWFTQRRLAALGLDGATRVCAACNAPPPLVLRVNRRRATPAAARAALEGQGATVAEGLTPDALRVAWRGDPGGLAVLADGRCVVQDATAQAVAVALDPQPGERVLDLCAAPGGKTLHAADLMADRGAILALDTSADGLGRLREAATRAGVTIVETRVADAAREALPPGTFDRVLLDAPCSNTGVFRRRVEARWRAGPDGIRALATTQRALLAVAAAAVRPGGRIAYSVCSIEPEEGPLMAGEARGLGLDVVEERTWLPGEDDGGYLATFTRR